MNNVAMLITYDLDFDVTWLFNKFFNIDTIVAKGCFGFLAFFIPQFFEILFSPDYTHPFSTTTGCSVHDDRVTDVLADFLCMSNIIYQTTTTWDNRNACFHHR